MEIGLREWLIVIGIVVIAGILFDGWRRMRGGKGKLKFRLDRSFSNAPDDEHSPELLGPARVLDTPAHKEPQLDEHDLPSVSMPARDKGAKRGKRGGEPSQGDLNLDLELDEGPSISARDDDHVAPVKPARGRAKPSVAEVEVKEPAAAQPAAEEVLVISVISRDPAGFKGPALLQNILESGLRFGEMDIFHRHESMAGNGEVLFSMANAVKPGVFDLDDIDLFSTPAVSFFLGLPGPRHPKQAFDVMVAAARKLSQELNGELKDDQRSVLTAQTIEHYRQRIVEFERRALTQKR
ncbi:cell division protein ZipA [Pseudomonas fragi]|uniref:cell division protein ZipA n=1 Tax=Pseudomonas fragi TaxID=296 RepID=UPI001472DBC1|nr:cell division protein ZipA [Pseudomonas fragi]NNA84516.1 cell division protein ZipA [Pseudomonas fragi]NNB09847.1 cell division protein ZipA [Pseudomonas fragi]NNB37716.1 cell division protein ZipA [Pseudomonas fragi]NNB57782.1 cell division protein ZipA [Pseudomonas fragi]